MAKAYNAGVKEYRETYWMPDYTPKETDLLACFKITPQDGVPREEVAAAALLIYLFIVGEASLFGGRSLWGVHENVTQTSH